jgi:hypothetical protein
LPCSVHRSQLWGLAALVGIARGGLSSADSRVPFALEVENATARVGQPTAVRAAIIPPKGMKRTSVYRHRLIDLSASRIAAACSSPTRW